MLLSHYHPLIVAHVANTLLYNGRLPEFVEHLVIPCLVDKPSLASPVVIMDFLYIEALLREDIKSSQTLFTKSLLSKIRHSQIG